MQSEANGIPPNFSLTQSIQDQNQSRQHGLHEHDLPPRQLRTEEGRSNPRRTAGSQRSSATSAAGSDDAGERPLRRLSPPSKHKSASPVDRISDHERASAYLPRKRKEGRVFTVVQRKKNASSGQVDLVDFPNGLLPALQDWQPLTSSRSFDPYTVSSIAFVVV